MIGKSGMKFAQKGTAQRSRNQRRKTTTNGRESTRIDSFIRVYSRLKSSSQKNKILDYSSAKIAKKARLDQGCSVLLFALRYFRLRYGAGAKSSTPQSIP
jgi:hypothetical protein